MKKVSSILLIVVFFFNLFGYRLVMHYLQEQSDVQMEASLDTTNFNEKELVTIKVPLSLPYQNDQADFERVDGELKINGRIYKYVKRKISEGQLVLLCLPDHKKMELESVKDEFFKNTADISPSNSAKKTTNTKNIVVKKPTAEYDNYFETLQGVLTKRVLTHTLLPDVHDFPSTPHISPEQPPDAITL